MDVNEVLQFVDRLVVEHTGNHLDDIQKAVIEGTWQKHTYDDIANHNNVSKNYASDTGYQLWKLLSNVLNEDIKKTNFRSTLERVHIESSQNICLGTNNNFHFGSQTINTPIKPYQKKHKKTQSKSIYHDLTQCPKIIKFYNRETELTKLSNYIFTQQIPLISILGLWGIGKTTLVKRFVDVNLDKFEVIIWKTLKFPKSLNLLINDLLNVCQQEPKETLDDKLTQLFNILKEKKSLIILDDLQNIFITGNFAGQYQPEFQDYQKFFTMMTETEHQSNMIVISQEQCPEIICLDENLSPINCIELSGLDNIDILKNTGLNDHNSFLKLIKLYEGNPFYLKDIVMLIKDIYDGNVAEFLAENNLIVTNKMRSHFNQLFNKLSPVEQQIVLELSKIEQPLTREKLKEKLEISSTDFIQGLQSLQERYLVTKIKADQTLFKLSLVFREYVRNCCKD